MNVSMYDTETCRYEKRSEIRLSNISAPDAVGNYLKRKMEVGLPKHGGTIAADREMMIPSEKGE